MSRTLTGLSRTREAAYQRRQQDRLARSVERLIAKEVSRATKEIAKYTDIGRQSAARFEHEQRIEQILQKHYNRVYQVIGGRVLKAGGKKDAQQVPPTEKYDQARIDWIREYAGLEARTIAGTTEAQTVEIIRQATAEGIAEGLTEKEIGEVIKRQASEYAASVSTLRARVIARTETAAAASSSTQAAAKATGLPMRKEWVTSGSRARDAHADANGQIVGLDEAFIVDGERLKYPADSSGSAANVINCRCVAIHIVD